MVVNRGTVIPMDLKAAWEYQGVTAVIHGE